MEIIIDGEKVFDFTHFCKKFDLKKDSFRAKYKYSFPEKIKVLDNKKYYPIDMTPNDWEPFKGKYVKPKIWRCFSFSYHDKDLLDELWSAICEENKAKDILDELIICRSINKGLAIHLTFKDTVQSKEGQTFIRSLRKRVPELYSGKWPISQINRVSRKEKDYGSKL